MTENLHKKMKVTIFNSGVNFTGYAKQEEKIKPLFTKEEGLKIAEYINNLQNNMGYTKLEYNSNKECFIFTDYKEERFEYAPEMILTDEGVKALYPIGSMITRWMWEEVKPAVG